MVATFNGWEDMPEAEREALELWEQRQRLVDNSTTEELSDAQSGVAAPFAGDRV